MRNPVTFHSFSSFREFKDSGLGTVSEIPGPPEADSHPSAKVLFRGECYVCERQVDFRIGAIQEAGGSGTTNWREELVCPCCRLNNRMRAAIHLMEVFGGPTASEKIYVTEQRSSLYKVLRMRHSRVMGSEYLGDRRRSGSLSWTGIRHEDVTRLSFKDAGFGTIVCCDVLEHVPAYQSALGEFHRCLKPGGTLVITVPFMTEVELNVVRASVLESGQIVHHRPPEFHADPVGKGEGILCYYHFGWQLLDDLKASGFAKSWVGLTSSRHYAYLGGYQIVVFASRD